MIRRLVLVVTLATLMIPMTPTVAQTPTPASECLPAPGALFAPRLTDLTSAAAAAVAATGGFPLVVETVESEAEPGVVVSQAPGPGEVIAAGGPITIAVAVAPAPTPTPAVTLAPASTPKPLSALSMAELKRRAKTPRYGQLLRNPEAFQGDLIYLRGEVLQAQDDDSGGQFALISVTRDRFGLWDDNVAVTIDEKPRVIPDDIVEFVMLGTGSFGYESAGAGYLTVPSGLVVKHRISKAR